MVRDAVGLRCIVVRGAGLTVLLCLCELNDDGDGEQLLPGEPDGFLDGFFMLELDVADPERWSANEGSKEEGWTYPLERLLTLSFTI